MNGDFLILRLDNMKKKEVLVLLSGGLDSPVCCYKLIKAGYQVSLIHFHNLTASSQGVEEKITDLRDALQKYQKNIPLYMIPFGPLQRELIKTVPAKKRMIIYRRFMFRIAEKIAKGDLATGDSLAQVASQTLDNMHVIYSATKKKVLHPLIGSDKKEIIAQAQEIGTYEISIRPYEDCCTFLVADRPETHGNLEEIEQIEQGIDVEKLVTQAVKAKKLT